MQIPTDPPQTLNGWTYRLRPAQTPTSRVVLMLHGWTGDENSMWFFAHNLPDRYCVILPRAPHPVPEGGYSWRKVVPGTWGFPTLEDLQPAAEMLMGFLADWQTVSGVDTRLFDVVGFSQGAALAYGLAVLFPQRVERVAALAGFLPRGCETRLPVLKGKRIFISHGRADDLVPVEKARLAAGLLQESGVQVEYCETDGGHKVSKECLRGIVSFFSRGQ